MRSRLPMADRSNKEKIQKLTDKYVEKIDGAVEEKTKEIMETQTMELVAPEGFEFDNNTLEIKDGKPVWTTKHCNFCLGCLHKCPQFAIQFGKNTAKHGQWYLEQPF